MTDDEPTIGDVAVEVARVMRADLRQQASERPLIGPLAWAAKWGTILPLAMFAIVLIVLMDVPDPERQPAWREN